MQKFNDSSIDIQLIGNFTVDSYGAQVQAQHALILDIIHLAEDLGVSFAFPTRTVYTKALKDEAALAKGNEETGDGSDVDKSVPVLASSVPTVRAG